MTWSRGGWLHVAVTPVTDGMNAKAAGDVPARATAWLKVRRGGHCRTSGTETVLGFRSGSRTSVLHCRRHRTAGPIRTGGPAEAVAPLRPRLATVERLLHEDLELERE